MRSISSLLSRPLSFVIVILFCLPAPQHQHIVVKPKHPGNMPLRSGKN